MQKERKTTNYKKEKKMNLSTDFLPINYKF